MPAITNPNASHIWDEAEVYIIAKSDLIAAGIDIESLVPESIEDELDIRWIEGFVGLLDPAKGIPVTPAIEIVHHDAFGRARFRSKAKKGTITTGFTAYEDNEVTKLFVLPGSRRGKVGAPKNMQFYVCYVARDEDIATRILISTMSALFELTSHAGIVEGEKEAYEVTVHHANDNDNDVFFLVDQDTAPGPKSVTFAGGPFTAGTFTLTVSGKTTAPIAFGATVAAIKTALELLSTVGSGNANVTGTVAAGLTVTVPGALSGNGAGLTPAGTITVA
ncbi:hypothetical protein [Rhodococcus globerulus]|uniref:Uncharacterized protein n=1 Tax=Rhodococcus globerulus TaxID=33008 RepID=A0ABU4C481_RHOGO|nr:hypothetical protein [Rhodococcus globerulus]MDV6271104.1 hypothetical protein [Rhodococcus globerulus]